MFGNMNRTVINIIWALLFLVAVIACEDKPMQKPEQAIAEISAGEAAEEAPDQISIRPEVIFSDSSDTKAILTAARARIYQKRAETLLDGGMKVIFFEVETGDEASILTADSGRIDDKTRNMRATGNVVVVSEDSGRRLESSLLEWDNKTQKLYSTEFVKIYTPTGNLQGYGFESDQNLTNYTFYKVSGEQR